MTRKPVWAGHYAQYRSTARSPLMDLAGPAAVHGRQLQFYCYVCSHTDSAGLLFSAERWFPSEMLYCLRRLLQIFKEHVSFYFYTTVKIMLGNRKDLEFLKSQSVIKIVFACELFILRQLVLVWPFAWFLNVVNHPFNGELSFCIRTVYCVEDWAGINAYTES